MSLLLSEHEVVIAGGGPTGIMLAGELKLAGVDAAIVERRANAEHPAFGTVTPPAAVLIRPDGYVAWVGDLDKRGLADMMSAWFGPPTAT